MCRHLVLLPWHLVAHGDYNSGNLASDDVITTGGAGVAFVGNTGAATIGASVALHVLKAFVQRRQRLVKMTKFDLKCNVGRWNLVRRHLFGRCLLRLRPQWVSTVCC